MERPAKRPHLLTPLDDVYNSAFGNRHAYYNDQVDELNDFDQEEEEDDEPVYDPDEDLQRKRARVDFKLKSTFEAIFEKYGRDFEGIGDEIDTRTGEIVVNNGHLLGMRHEMDAGDDSSEEGEDGLEDDMAGFDEDAVMEDLDGNEDDEDEDEDDDQDPEDGEDEEEFDEEDIPSDGDMEEDDMILRGFAQASQQFMHRQRLPDPDPPRVRLGVSIGVEDGQQIMHQSPPQVLPHARDRYITQTEARYHAAPRPNTTTNVLPSRSEILAQFGPQLGPEIFKYVSKKGPLEDSRIEPAWRVPDIVPEVPSPPPRRPVIRSMVRQLEPEPERSPSPDNAPSIWALNGSKKRKRFSRAEDELLADFIANTRRQGLSLSSNVTWKQLEAIAPRHDWNTWKARYKRKFTYLPPAPRDESDVSVSETSASTGQMLDEQLGFSEWVKKGQMHAQQSGFSSGFAQSAPPRPSRPVDAHRPIRIRKPAQREGIVTWNEAIATIASVDPVGNADLLDDARRTASDGFGPMHPISSSFEVFPTPLHSRDKRGLQAKQSYHQPIPYIDPSGSKHPYISGSVEDELAMNSAVARHERATVEAVACPHAECTLYPATLYRLERRLDEEISPLCSHLLRVHRIAPFPCVELDCERRGAKGYFMQNDLVRHVKETHPYVAALHRLKGRVDSALLKQRNVTEQPPNPKETHLFLGQQPKDSDFMSPQQPFIKHGVSSELRIPLASRETVDKTSAPRAGATAASDSASSMHVHQSSGLAQKVFPGLRAASSDSDLLILDENPFLENTYQAEENFPVLPEVLASIESSTSRLQGPTPVSPPRSKPATSCTYPDCRMALSNIDDMMVHLRTHFERTKSPQPSQKANAISKAPLLASIPNSQSSSVGSLPSLSALAMPLHGESSTTSHTSLPSRPPTEAFIDRSYEFSDDEEGIRPVVKRPAPQLSAKSFFGTSTNFPMPQSVQQPSEPSALTLTIDPTPKVESPESAPLPRSSSALSKNNSSPRSNSSRTGASSEPKQKHPALRHIRPLTPTAEAGPRKSILGNVLDSEDFDELSMSENGFVLISARPRSGPSLNSALQIRVKSEQPEYSTAATSAKLIKKRTFSTLQVDDDEIDELGETSPSMLTVYRLGSKSTSKDRRKTIAGEHDLSKPRPMKASKLRKSFGSEVTAVSKYSIQPTAFRTPTKYKGLPTRAGTPLLDLVKSGHPEQGMPNKADGEIPSTSEMGSSPNTYSARTQGQDGEAGRSSVVQVLITPYKNNLANRVIKEEDDHSVVTPGGTMRNCGQDGFACGRAFCFKCNLREPNAA